MNRHKRGLDRSLEKGEVMWLSVNDTSRVESSSEVKRKSRKKWNIAIGVLVLVIILLLLIQNFLSVPEGSNQKTDPIARPGIGEVMEGDLPNMSDEQLREYLKNKQDASLFTVAVNAEATFEKGSTILNLMVANVEKNIVDCYFEILDKDEVIYTSPIM